MKIEYPEKKTITKELLPQIVERIFTVCKTDSNFPLKQKMSNIDEQLSTMHRQIQKQEALVLQSKSLHSNLVTRLSNLQKSNLELRDRLLESLGSEI